MVTKQDMIMPTALGDRIRDARRNLNMTQGELAGDDYSVSYISAIERNKIRPSLRALAWIANRLTVNLSDLLATDGVLSADQAQNATAEEAIHHAFAQARIALTLNRFEDARTALTEIQETIAKPSHLMECNELLARAYIGMNMGQEARELLEENLNIVQNIDLIAQETSRNLLGQAYVSLDMYMAAVECHRQCLAAITANVVRDPVFKMDVLFNLGVDYLMLGQNEKAIEQFNEAVKVGRFIVNPVELAQTYWQIAAEYRREGSAHLATRYDTLAQENLRMANNRRTLTRVHARLGDAYAAQNNHDQAEQTLKDAAELAQEIGDRESRSFALVSLARTQINRGANKEALATAHQALDLAKGSGSQEALGRAHLVNGEALFLANKIEDADKSFTEGLKILEEIGLQGELAQAYGRYAELLEKRGDVKKALQYMKMQAAKRMVTR